MKTDFKKEPRTFYRIEYKDGFGLHNACDECGNSIVDYLPELIERHSANLPNMRTDLVISRVYVSNSIWRFCFNSIEDLQRLVFTDELVKLKDLGFKVYKIVANNYVISPYQAIIDINSIISKEEYD